MSAEHLSLNVKTAFDGFDIDIAETLTLDGATAIFGASGAGKTTLMRSIAGFQTPQSGRIALGDEAWFDSAQKINLPAWRRPAGYMFQDGRLFAHLTVRGNLAFADQRSPGGQYARDHIVDAFALAPLLDRRVTSLSGGECQRVALARTLLSRPRLLLLDEPLAALDRKRKSEILPYLKDLPQRFGAPTLFVSHDIEEVAQLADNILLLANGRVDAYGAAADIISMLDLEPVTGRYDASTLLEGRVAGHDQSLRLTRVALGGAIITMPINDRLADGDAVRLRIRAQDVAIATTKPEGISIRNALPGAVHAITEQSGTAFAEIFIDIGDACLRSRITRASVADLGLAEGMPVYALIKSVSFDGRLS